MCTFKINLDMFIPKLVYECSSQLKGGSKCPLTDEWLNKMRYIQKMVYYIAIKGNKLIHATTWITLKNFMLCERSQSQGVAYCISTIPFLWSIQLSIPGTHHQNYSSEIFNLCHSVFSSSYYFSFYSLLLLHLSLYLVETSRVLNSSLLSVNPLLSLLSLLSSSDHVICHFNYFLANIKSFAQMSILSTWKDSNLVIVHLIYPYI